MDHTAKGGGQDFLAPDRMRQLTVTLVPITTINPHPRNARTHPKSQIKQLSEGMKQMGWTSPILVDDSNRIIAGHARLEAAKLLGLTEVPIIRLTDRTEAQLRAYCIADNKLAANAGWDMNLLKLELEEILKIEGSFDLNVTGFTLGEIDVILDQTCPARADQAPPIDPQALPVTQTGDLWTLGTHRIICGDARDPAAYTRLMDGKPAQMVFTDPPWNVPIEGNVGGLGSIKHEDFAMASGEMTEPQFIEFLSTVIALLVQHSANGSIHFIAIDWRHVYELMTAARDRYTELKNLCVWNKTNGGMGTFYRSKHELILVFKNGKGRHVNNIELGRNGRHRTNVWDYAGVNSLRAGRMDELRMHPTVKPVALVADAIKDCSRRRGIVLDPFLGSGSTVIAAELAGRCGYGIEIDPRYVDTAIRRWQELTGEPARHADSGKTFDQLAARSTSNGQAS